MKGFPHHLSSSAASEDNLLHKTDGLRGRAVLSRMFSLYSIISDSYRMSSILARMFSAQDLSLSRAVASFNCSVSG